MVPFWLLMAAGRRDKVGSGPVAITVCPALVAIANLLAGGFPSWDVGELRAGSTSQSGFDRATYPPSAHIFDMRLRFLLPRQFAIRLSQVDMTDM
ncbi:hypothetical protein Alches_19350 [Alicyclobacillus hesperidum subsp. aegles]|nr:hypothetical protein Alches_19350 [Alicyclobacillus hesperidum subsp. aegles]